MAIEKGSIQGKPAPSIKNLTITKTGSEHVLAHASVESRSRADVTHRVVRTRTLGWVCSCEVFMFKYLSTGNQCMHIQTVVEELVRLRNQINAVL